MKQYDLYTDGSHFKRGNGRLGIGGVLVDLTQQGPLGRMIGEFGVELNPADLRKDFGPGAETCSNPTAELTAVLVSLSNTIRGIVVSVLFVLAARAVTAASLAVSSAGSV